MKRNIKNKIGKDLEFIRGDVLGILLFGSMIKGEHHETSDIDICLVNPRDKSILIEVFKEVGNKYDVKIFEDLPLYIQIDIIKNYVVIFGDETELSYYFYRFRKIWTDMEERIKMNQFKTVKEMLNTRRRWLNEKAKVSEKV